MEATFWRHWWWSGGYFGSIFFVKDLLPKPEVSGVTRIVMFFQAGRSSGIGADVQTKQAELRNNLLAGTIGGFIGTAINTPCE